MSEVRETKKMKKITLVNDFHNTAVRVHLPENGHLTNRQWRRVRETLCGIADCTCGTLRGEIKDDMGASYIQTYLGDFRPREPQD